jgi:type II secretory pathway pseudopilin PulG
MRRSFPTRLSAFTLLEVMIVVGMAALVMAISIPFVQRTMRRDAVFQAVRLVEDACRNARTLAILNNSGAELILHPEDRSLSVRAAAALATVTPAGEESFAEEPPPPNPSSRFGVKPFSGTFGEDVTIELLDVNFTEYKEAPEARVRFHPNGTSDEFTIVLRIGPTAWRKVSLETVTGLPMIEVIR